eukprot:scaffold20364_cov18-Tisochrysis_lutea.AAC.2
MTGKARVTQLYLPSWADKVQGQNDNQQRSVNGMDEVGKLASDAEDWRSLPFLPQTWKRTVWDRTDPPDSHLLC